MSNLTIFRDHCRAMATHTRAIAAMATEELKYAGVADDDQLRITLAKTIDTALAECALWEQLADEIDHYLAGELLEDTTEHTEPLWDGAL